MSQQNIRDLGGEILSYNALSLTPLLLHFPLQLKSKYNWNRNVVLTVVDVYCTSLHFPPQLCRLSMMLLGALIAIILNFSIHASKYLVLEWELYLKVLLLFVSDLIVHLVLNCCCLYLICCCCWMLIRCIWTSMLWFGIHFEVSSRIWLYCS